MHKLSLYILLLTTFNFSFLSARRDSPSGINESERENLAAPQANKNESFDRHFQLLDTLFLNYASLTIGDISKLIVLNDDTKLVIYDQIARSLIWVDLKLRQHKSLSVENVMPGYKLDVISIYKDPGNGFWVSGLPNYFFKFDNDGKLIKRLEIAKHYLSYRFCIDYDSNIIAYMEDNWPNYILRYNTTTDKVDKLFDLNPPAEFKNANRRMNSGGGILMDRDKKIFFSNTIENKIYVYNLKGEVQATFKSNNKNFKILETDMPEDKAGVMAFFGKKPNFSSVLSINFLNNESVIALYVVDNRPNIEIFSKYNGKVLNKAEIILPLHMAYAENNLIYLVYHPEEELKSNSYSANPIIIRYKFKGQQNGRK